jgi:hypothetical protein
MKLLDPPNAERKLVIKYIKMNVITALSIGILAQQS